MKNSILIGYLFLCTSFFNPIAEKAEIIPAGSFTENIFIIISDGLRWQEVFCGADASLINNEIFTPDTASLKSMYWAESDEERRKLLMPFFWNVIANKGQLIGNRKWKNKMDVANMYAVSYPGYNEMFTGTTDITISGNSKKNNKNINVLEYLNCQDELAGKIAIFSSWDVFPFILNRERSNLIINSGYEEIKTDTASATINMINAVQQRGLENKSATRYDMLTFTAAKEYIKNHQPKIVVIGLGETDDFAHQKRYDLYLQQIAQFDKMIAELWNLVQTTPAYKNKTSFLITTDHGRGYNEKHWSGHGFFIGGSSHTWMAMMGHGIPSSGERKTKQQIYSKQIAQTIAALKGSGFSSGQK
jgi:hypothetical protein